MKAFYVLLVSFCVMLFAGRIIFHHYDFVFAARWAMSAMLFFTSIAHFAFPRGMVLMIPDFIPAKLALVYATGIFELLAAIGLQIQGIRNLSSWLLIVFLILIAPANILAAWKHLNYEKGTLDGKGPAYLWFRIPLQILFIAWTYFCIR